MADQGIESPTSRDFFRKLANSLSISTADGHSTLVQSHGGLKGSESSTVHEDSVLYS
jgi:hypothetical protein